MTIAHSAPLPVPATLEIISNASPQFCTTGGDANKANLLQGPDFAKPNPVLDADVQKMLDSIMALAPRYALLKNALKEYVLTDKPLIQIASEHSYTPPALTYWARKLGLPERPRGRPLLLKPTEDHKRVIALVRQHGVVETARREGISAQWVSQVVKRWAPELKGKRINRTVVPLPQPMRRPARKIVVSFRLSAAEWGRLLDTQLTTDEENLSGFEKARAILLHYLDSTGGDGGEATQAAAAPEPTWTNADFVNVYNQKAA
jgi:hypothetical protein